MGLVSAGALTALRAPGSKHTPDRAAMARAVRAFLRAAGHDVSKRSDLTRTPERVADAWCESFLDGYRFDPRELLAERFEVPTAAPVLVRDLAIHGVCPHHLLPWFGVAHVAYVPNGAAVGFSRLGQLAACYAHRLTLQEEAAHHTAHALVDNLGAYAALCAIEGEHTCLTLRGERQRGARIWCEGVAGDASLVERLRGLVLARR